MLIVGRELSSGAGPGLPVEQVPNASPQTMLWSHDHVGANLGHNDIALSKALSFPCFIYLICKMGMVEVSLLLGCCDDSTVYGKSLAQEELFYRKSSSSVITMIKAL